jgi:hypothetical protein
VASVLLLETITGPGDHSDDARLEWVSAISVCETIQGGAEKDGRDETMKRKITDLTVQGQMLAMKKFVDFSSKYADISNVYNHNLPSV